MKFIFGNHGREESKLLSLFKRWEIRLPPARKGLEVRRLADSFHGLTPSSNVSHFKKIFSLSNLNDWMIADGAFFVIRCIILLSNETEINQSSGLSMFIQSVVQSHEGCVDLQMIDTSEMRTPQLHRDKHYATYVEGC